MQPYRWIKHGLIFQPDPKVAWMQSHAQAPTPMHLSGDTYRIFFASRDDKQRSHIGYFDWNAEDPTHFATVSKDPVLAPGSIGTFDQDGVYASSIFKMHDKLYLYYIGWTKGAEQPLFYSAIGLAVSSDNGQTFTRYSVTPIVDRTDHDPCLLTSPVVFSHNAKYHMLYVSGVKWERDANQKLQSFYHVKMAQSPDGINWIRNGKVAIDFKNAEETNIARASVVQQGKYLEAWYCYHETKQSYRIGLATSFDGLSWQRQDHLAGIAPSTEGYDSEMMCYPYVIEHKGKRFMFYNGNGFGKNGICLASMST